MRRIDEPFLKHPFYGSRRMVRHLCRIPRTGFTRICSRAWRSSGPIRSGGGAASRIRWRSWTGRGQHVLAWRLSNTLDAGFRVEAPVRRRRLSEGECAPGRGAIRETGQRPPRRATRGDRSARRRMYETIRLRLRGHSHCESQVELRVEIAGSLASSSDWQPPTVGWPSRA